MKGDPNIPRDDEDSDKERDDDEDIDDDDFDDLDFELDSLDDPDSPDSWNEEDDFASGRGSSTGSNLSLDTTPGRLSCRLPKPRCQRVDSLSLHPEVSQHCTGLDFKACTWLRDFLPIFPKIAVRQTVGGRGVAEGNSKLCKPFSPTQYFV